jgi:hypothetical protein
MASTGSLSAGLPRENRGVSPVTAPAFLAAAAKSSFSASATSCLARSSATASAFWRLTDAVTLSLI